MLTAELRALWVRFREQRQAQDRAALISRYRHLVIITVQRFALRLPTSTLEPADLISAGSLGLVRAVDTFDPSRTVKFETYAIALIRGALLEEIRNADPLTRGLRKRANDVVAATEALSLALDRAPHLDEVAEVLGLTLTEVAIAMRGADAAAHQHSLDKPLWAATQDGETAFDLADRIPGGESDPAYTGALTAIRNAALKKALSGLPPRERRVVVRHFWGGLTFRQVGQEEKISESRAFQLYQQGTRRLRTELQLLDDLFSDV
jgi:RNA polymerase sigma factor for flagellar operon FliA